MDLCAERYTALDTRLDPVDAKISSLSDVIREVHDMVQRMSEKRTDQLIGWGVGLIGALSATVIYLVTHYVLK